ncbi:MAG: hypothetical protein MUE73_14160 [Planctomycetes bacterium]|nr:hypothetical protein [Planctomycetota bacterium]
MSILVFPVPFENFPVPFLFSRRNHDRWVYRRTGGVRTVVKTVEASLYRLEAASVSVRVTGDRAAARDESVAAVAAMLGHSAGMTHVCSPQSAWIQRTALRRMRAGSTALALSAPRPGNPVLTGRPEALPATTLARKTPEVRDEQARGPPQP